jgi:hypothetical protein
MKQNREPLFFANSQGGETEGLVRRFLSANASLEGEHLDLWFPVFQDDQQTVSFIVSLSDVSFRRKHPSDDLTFFKGIMSLSYAAVRNVESYQNVIKAQEREERIRRGFQRLQGRWLMVPAPADRGDGCDPGSGDGPRMPRRPIG